MAHNVPTSTVDPLISGPSPSKITQVSNMQNYIQGLLGDTHHTFLQGSYKNDTARSDINDVDIVAVRLQTFSTVHTGLRFPTSVLWDTIFSEIEAKLRNQRLYTWTVERGDKCIKVRGAFNADVIPAVQVNSHLEDPIVVYSFRTSTEKLNHPRLHYDNGVVKNKATGGNYKPAARMFKNWAYNHFGEDRNIFSSFKVEALVHGVPDDHFSSDHVSNFIVGADNIVRKLNTRSALPLLIPSVCGKEDITQGWGLVGRGAFVAQLNNSLQLAVEAYQAGSVSQAEAKWREAFNL